MSAREWVAGARRTRPLHPLPDRQPKPGVLWVFCEGPVGVADPEGRRRPS